ncbi:MAG TPA: bifunctional glycosyltransferase/class I SAM-dependent methyltransferase [bacterium]|nr:bifunctional glycosyltransferase/class I SAM-dependent methyltransferase [bacterium]
MAEADHTEKMIRPDQAKVRAVVEHKRRLGDKFPRYAVFIVAYEAMERLAAVLRRIPPEIYEVLTEIYIFDDFSRDRTVEVTREYLAEARLEKVSLYKNPRNYGYGGNQKLGYEYAIAKGYDYVLLLHGDGQYAPEYLPDLMLPTLEQGAEVVFGSRMLEPGAARAGGMPMYKYLGNRVLTAFENFILGLDLTEFHSGYRLYSTRLLQKIQYKLNTDDFHFDTQIIIQGLAAGERIVEVPIPTYYGDEICHVNGMKYALDVVLSVLSYRLHQLGIMRKERYVPVAGPEYQYKDFPASSHEQIIDVIEPGSDVLDLGCGHGLIAARLKAKGCRVTGVDRVAAEEIAGLDGYYCADLNAELCLPCGRDFDYVVLADVVEHLAEPEKLLMAARRYLTEDGLLVMSVPNIALWVYRLSLAAGRFEYTGRGVMDRTHLRFFTLVTARYLLWQAGFNIVEERYAPVPFHLIITLPGAKGFVDFLTRAYHLLARLWPRLFAYQLIFKARIVRLEWEELKKIPVPVPEPHPHLKAGP